MKIAVWFSAVIGLFLLVAMIFTAGWDLPPVAATQNGYRGLGMEHVSNPRKSLLGSENEQVPEALPPAEPGSPPATEVYENVQVLTDLSEEEFMRVMGAITEWVSPEQGCEYCHDIENLAADKPYTKIVARRMLEMTRDVNQNWTAHVGDTGVTCFTCHRGKPVPEQVWFSDPGPKQAGGSAADRAGQNLAAEKVGLTSLPYDSLSPFLLNDNNIRVETTTALPTGNLSSIKQTEWTYGLMMHISDSLGVNCTFCHNSRAFYKWENSTPQRTTAWHGIGMTRNLNQDYLVPLGQEYPASRLGPHGDAPKANCATCHQGVSKPLNGAKMLKDYPELGKAGGK